MVARSQITNLTATMLIAACALQVLATEAIAAKEKFERTKPHVNVGTIGYPPREPNQLTGNSESSSGDNTQERDASTECRPGQSVASGGQASC